MYTSSQEVQRILAEGPEIQCTYLSCSGVQFSRNSMCIEKFVFIGPRLPLILQCHLSPISAQNVAQVRSAEQSVDGISQVVGVCWIYENPAEAIPNDFRQPTHFRCNNWSFTSHRLKST